MGMTLKTPFNVMRRAGWDFAPRDPITIGNAILAAIGVQTSSIALIYAVGYLSTTALTSFALRKLVPSAGAANRGTLINSRQAAAPHEYVYGQTRKGGIITFLETSGASNKYLHMIVALAGPEVEAIGDIYVNDEVVTLDANGYVTGTRWKSKIRVLKQMTLLLVGFRVIQMTNT
jgi:hypothetical protein